MVEQKGKLAQLWEAGGGVSLMLFRFVRSIQEKRK